MAPLQLEEGAAPSQRPHLALKVDADTFRGTREGVPNLIKLLKQHGANATFLFSLGPDHTGRAIKRVFRRGFLGKARRTSVLKHYGLKTLLYGTLLPGPDIGKECAHVLRAVQDSGFEVGIHTYNHVKWQDHVSEQAAQWTQQEMERAFERFKEIFKTDPKIHGAAGWQMNRHAFRLTQCLGFDYCSDTRGSCPFVPVQNAEVIACPQLPTTLATLDELIGLGGIDENNVVNHILDSTRTAPANGHVYTLHAELEGMRLAPIFKALMEGWKDQGYQLASLSEYFEWLPEKNLPRHEVHAGEIPGRSGTLMLQGRQFLSPLPPEALIRPTIS